MAVSYTSTSPYLDTGRFGNYLDVMTKRPIPRAPDDVVYEIQQVYQYRPDMLAYDLYGDAGLWWVFAARNPNTFEDPIWDFSAGVSLYLPKQATLIESLGL